MRTTALIIVWILFGCGPTTTFSDSETISWIRKVNYDYINVSDLDSIKELDLSLDVIHSCVNSHQALEVSDADCRHLRNLRNLEGIYLNGQVIGVAWVDEIAKFHSLRRMTLVRTRVNDADVSKFTSLRSIQELDLSGTDISDESLKFLSRLPELKRLVIYGTKISKESVVDFQRKNPTVSVEWSEKFEDWIKMATS